MTPTYSEEKTLTLNQLYAERDLLRSRRATLERRIEDLVPLETKNRIAINAATQGEHRPSRAFRNEVEVEPTTLADLPEYAKCGW